MSMKGCFNYDFWMVLLVFSVVIMFISHNAVNMSMLLWSIYVCVNKRNQIASKFCKSVYVLVSTTMDFIMYSKKGNYIFDLYNELIIV